MSRRDSIQRNNSHRKKKRRTRRKEGGGGRAREREAEGIITIIAGWESEGSEEDEEEGREEYKDGCHANGSASQARKEGEGDDVQGRCRCEGRWRSRRHGGGEEGSRLQSCGMFTRTHTPQAAGDIANTQNLLCSYGAETNATARESCLRTFGRASLRSVCSHATLRAHIYHTGSIPASIILL